MASRAQGSADLSKQAIKVARRLQALPKHRAYILTFVKSGPLWLLSVMGEAKIETIRA